MDSRGPLGEDTSNQRPEVRNKGDAHGQARTPSLLGGRMPGKGPGEPSKAPRKTRAGPGKEAPREGCWTREGRGGPATAGSILSRAWPRGKMEGRASQGGWGHSMGWGAVSDDTSSPACPVRRATRHNPQRKTQVNYDIAPMWPIPSRLLLKFSPIRDTESHDLGEWAPGSVGNLKSGRYQSQSGQSSRCDNVTAVGLHQRGHYGCCFSWTGTLYLILPSPRYTVISNRKQFKTITNILNTKDTCQRVGICS